MWWKTGAKTAIDSVVTILVVTQHLRTGIRYDVSSFGWDYWFLATKSIVPLCLRRGIRDPAFFSSFSNPLLSATNSVWKLSYLTHQTIYVLPVKWYQQNLPLFNFYLDNDVYMTSKRRLQHWYSLWNLRPRKLKNLNRASNSRLKIALASKLNLGTPWAQKFHENDLIITELFQE